jgi:uncharacterized circularly permuted ATP-grasp superfamily protein
VPTLREGFYDEMIDGGGTPRPHAQTLVEALEALGPDQLAAAGRRRDAIFMQQGITFDAAGPDADGPVRDRPFIDDVYHGREIVHDGLVPWELLGYT